MSGWSEADLAAHYARQGTAPSVVPTQKRVKSVSIGSTWTLDLRGHCPAKKSLYRRGKRGLFLDREVADQVTALVYQAKAQWCGMEPLEHPELSITFHVRSRRSDRDGKLATVLDVLQRAGVLINDNVAHANGVLTLHPAVVSKDERVVIEVMA